MPKKLFAVTNVKVSNEPGGFFPAGEVIDPAKFTKEQLVELHDAGAVEIRVVEDEVAEPEPEAPVVTPETPETPVTPEDNE